MEIIKPTLCVVVPCYNEEDVLPRTAPLLVGEIVELAKASLCDGETSRVMFVDDGSSDSTWEVIRSLSQECSKICGVRLSRNRGHQNALLCGLSEAVSAGCSCAISIDADGQDDITVMKKMMEYYAAGKEVIYGVRTDRSSDSLLKRFTAESYYKVMSWLGAETVYNHADYRLMSARAIEALLQMPEVNLYLRGMVPLVGYSSAIVGYTREERVAGESHYPISKMLALAVDGVTSMSMRPLRLVGAAGVILCSVGTITSVVLLSRKKALDLAVCATFTGVQLMALGVVGEYVGKTYIEAKHRPRWVVADRI